MLREQAHQMMKPLQESHIYSIVYGSVARGDTSPSSDVDVFIPSPPSPTLIEAILETQKVRISRRSIVQATPSYVAKAYIMIDDDRGYSFPLIPMRTTEADFTRFAGEINYHELSENTRVMGVNKDLKLITPTEKGHKETQIQGIEGIVAKKLGVDLRIVRERVRTLERRKNVGRTGVYVNRVLSPEESFSSVFRELAKNRPGLRRRIRNN